MISGFWSWVEVACADEQAVLSAREHFDRGVLASQQGDLSGAAEHFERARAQGTHPVVLYNLGQTYSALGRPVHAERVLRLYLEHVAVLPETAERRREVESLLRFNESRVGELTVAVDPPNATIELDGVALDPASGGSLRVAAGPHVVVARHEGHHAAVASVEVRAGTRGEIRLRLLRIPSDGIGLVRPTCRVPGARLLLDGVEVGMASETSALAVATGDHVLRFERPGYLSTPLELRVNSAAPLDVPCVLELDPELPASQRAELKIVVNESGADVLVNGEPLRSRFVPAGRHVVEVSQLGYEPWRRTIYAEPGKAKLVLVPLIKTAERRRAEDKRARQLWGYAIGGAGAVFAGLSTALFLINQDRYQDFRDDDRAFARRLASGDRSAADGVVRVRLQQRAADIQRTDDIAFGTAFVSGALFATSIGLLFGGRDAPH